MKPEPLKGKEHNMASFTHITEKGTYEAPDQIMYQKEDVKAAVKWLMRELKLELAEIQDHKRGTYTVTHTTAILKAIKEAFPDVLEEEKP